MPIHRLDETPNRRGTLVDLTCDSDGRIDRFIGHGSIERSLPLHDPKGAPYYLGCFLTGAYQDILGDMHNLFGRVNEVHVYGDAEELDNFFIETTISGTTVREALRQVQYSRSDLRKRMEDIVRRKVRAGTIRPKRGAEFVEQYVAALEEYTYYNYRPVGTAPRTNDNDAGESDER